MAFAPAKGMTPKPHTPPLSKPALRLLHGFDWATLAGGVIILLSLSYDIIHNRGYVLSPAYLDIQLIICMVFIGDFIVHWLSAPDPARYFRRNVIFLLVSIPFLNIVHWCGATPSRDWNIILKAAPLIRSLASVVIVAGWLARRRIRQLFASYLFIVTAFTYIAALIFYCYEIDLNPKLDGFGNALWWAWMNVTTVGAEIFPVTAVGKVVCVLLPSLGMMMFPIFTIYVTDLITNRKAGKDS